MQVKILDCPHGFGVHTYARVGTKWHMITVQGLPKHTTVEHEGTKRAIASMIAAIPVKFCAGCGQKLDKTAPVRNYVAGNNIPLDERVQKILEEANAPR